MRNLLRKLSRYFITAGVAAVFDAGGFALLETAGAVTSIAASLSFCVAALVNYVLTAQFVFGQQPTIRGFRRFFVASLLGLAINVGVTLGVIEVLSLPPILAKLVGIGVAFFANFVINLIVVFRPGREPDFSLAIPADKA